MKTRKFNETQEKARNSLNLTVQGECIIINKGKGPKKGGLKC